jgi:hypothetical protein
MTESGTSNNSIFHFLAGFLLPKHVRNAMNSAYVFRAQLLCMYMAGISQCLKCLDFSYFPITNSGIFSDSSIFAHMSTATVTLLVFLPSLNTHLVKELDEKQQPTLLCIKYMLWMALTQK